MKNTLVLLLFLALALVGLSLVAGIVNWQKDESSDWVQHTEQVLYTQSDLLGVCQEVMLNTRNCLLTHKRGSIDFCDASEREMGQLFSQLEELTADNVAQMSNMARLEPNIMRYMACSREIILAGNTSKLAVQKLALENIQKALEAVDATESLVLEDRQELSQRRVRWLWVALVIQLLCGLGLIVVATSILKSYKRESDEKLRLIEQEKRAAEKANVLKTQFVADVSHEIQSPLVDLVAKADQLVCDLQADKDQSRPIAFQIQDASRYLLGVLDSLVEFSDLQAGRVKVAPTRCRLRELFEQIEDQTRSQAEHKGLLLDFYIDPELPVEVMVDASKLNQILINLVVNAIMFTDRGAIQARAEKVGDRIYVTISDTGKGIPKLEQAVLFDPFALTDDSIVRKFAGTGLGLSIAKQYVELMGGQIGIDSDVGRGSTFWLSVPLLAAEAASRV